MPWWGWLLSAALVMLGIYWTTFLVLFYQAGKMDEVWWWHDECPSPSRKRRR